jgi:hypothetical protein
MRYLLFSVSLCGACASDYKGLQSVSTDNQCIESLKLPDFTTSWYDAGIEVAGKYIGGLLLIKDMPDSSARIVFTNEAGFKFFDFEFSENGQFRIHHIIRQLDKKPVIRLLRSDFELMLGTPFKEGGWQSWEKDGEKYTGVVQKKEKHYFITGKDCASLHRIESGSQRKRKVSLYYGGTDMRDPDSIRLQHHTFAMQIKLVKIIRN